ncbi:MAG: 50S ribosomal protein L4 [Candidatus Pacebacteria bacterium]|nr:50S ribosomal protein L4 [Candidatus Paceibacterota bacterium]
MKLNVIRTASRNSQIAASEVLFAQSNPVLLAQAVRVYLSNKRQGTSKTQNRSAVTRTTRKWYRQKGTGNARHGARDAALFVGGSIAHGPRGVENWKKSLSTSQKKQALAAALTAQAEGDNVLINDEILELKGKTKEAALLLNKIFESFNQTKLEDYNRVLIVVKDKKEPMMRAVKNLPQVKILLAANISALPLAAANKIVLTSAALEVLEERVS